MMMTSFILFLTILALVPLVVAMRPKGLHIWLGSYLRQFPRRHLPPVPGRPVDILVCFADHFEPRWKNPGYQIELERVQTWVREYPLLARRHRDHDGCPPKHTFFFPEEEYRPEHLDLLAGLCREGLGEVEIHLHHDRDTATDLREKLLRFKALLHERHGLLCKDPRTGEIVYGFIHGNWALDNSRLDGRWCGVNNELDVLQETGCYADFTLPSAPGETQTKKVNSLYYASEDPQQPKSHNWGIDVQVGRRSNGDLLMIQGPLALNWRVRKWGILPKIENGEIDRESVPTPERIDLWIQQRIQVRGRPDWIFVKLHMHGAQERNFEALLGKPMDDLFSYLETKYNDGIRYRLHYVTAREMYNICKAAEAGKTGDPGQYRDYLL